MIGLVFAAVLSHSASATDSIRAHNIQVAATFFDETTLLSVVREQAPDRYDFLMDLRDTDEDHYLAQLHWDGHVLLLEHADPRVPELRQDLWMVDAEIGELAEDWAQASGNERRSLQGQLVELAEERVELQTMMLEIQVEIALQRMSRMDNRLDALDEVKASRKIVRRAMRKARR